MNNLFVYVENSKLDDVLKYGMKLSEFSNKVLNISDGQNKTGILAFLTPKDSELYYDNNYTCIRVLTNNINYIIYNKTCESQEYFNEFVSTQDKYNIGDYEEPLALIYSTILPENIIKYNKIIDIPLVIENSKDYYYENAVNKMLQSENFSNYELYQMLLILGNQKNIFNIKYNENGIRVYEDNKYGTFYTKKGKT